MRIAVACASGSAKGVFVHGVLSAFRERAVPVEAYAASSSSTIPAAYAAAGALADLEGAAHWRRGAEKLRALKDVAEREESLADAPYATTRMLHAWTAPGWIDGQPCTCMCPAVEMAELGYERVVAVSPEAGPFYRDIYQAPTIASEWNGARMLFMQPDFDLKEIGVDYLSAQADGLQRAFDLGRSAGLRFVDGDALSTPGRRS